MHTDTPPLTEITLRQHRVGDIGWIIHRHALIYFEEYGWDERFEALVADVASKFILNYDPVHERCWIAERNGVFLGCVFLVKSTEEIAKLRLMLVEPTARGLGIGTLLVHECISFARQAGYKKIKLWTNDVLLPARRIYERVGFKRIHLEPHNDFGEGLIGETWELEL